MDDLLDLLQRRCEEICSASFSWYHPQDGEPRVHRHLRDIMQAQQLVDGTSIVPWHATDTLPAVVEAPVADFAAYADDLTFWVCSPDTHLTAATAQILLDDIVSWGRCNGVPVSSKSSARWLTRATNTRAFPRLPVRLPLAGLDAMLIPPLSSPAATPIRVLGLWVDQRLEFRFHAKKVEDAVMEVLVNIHARHRGMPPSLRALLVAGTAHAIITYGLAAYWDSAGAKARSILEKLWGRAAVAIVGAGPTTSHAAAIPASGHYPLPVHVQHLRLKLQRRIWNAGAQVSSSYLQRTALREFHSRHRCIRDLLQSPPPATPLQRRFSPALSHTPYHSLMQAYDKSRFHTTLTLDGSAVGKSAPREEAESDENLAQLRCFNARQLAATASPMEVWTDASVVPAESSAGAYLLVEYDRVVAEGHTSLGAVACSYSMERAAIRAGIAALVERCRRLAAHYRSIRFVTDSLSVLEELKAGPLHQVEEDTEAIWAAAAHLPTDRIEWVFVFSHVHPEKDARGQLLPLDPQVPEYYNMYVDRLASRHASAAATGPLWIQDLLRPQHDEIRRSAGDPQSATEAQRHTLQYRTVGHIVPGDVQHMTYPPHVQHLLLGLRVSACTFIPGYRPHQPEPCRWCGALIGRRSAVPAPGTTVQEAALHVFRCPAKPPPNGATLAGIFEEPVEPAIINFLCEFARGPGGSGSLRPHLTRNGSDSDDSDVHSTVHSDDSSSSNTRSDDDDDRVEADEADE